MKLQPLPQPLAVCRLNTQSEVPAWTNQSASFLSITRTPDELSIVCEQSAVPEGVKVERDWTAFRIVGTLDFSLTGVLASIANPLAAEKISIFAISTFDTDYVLIRSADWSRAQLSLQKSGFTFTP